MTLKRIKCHECAEGDCDSPENLTICENAIKCWKMSLRDPDGKTRGVRGCVMHRDQVHFYCKRLHFNSTEVNGGQDVGGQFFTECCQENFCNNGNFTYPSSISNQQYPINNMEFVFLMFNILTIMILIVRGIHHMFWKNETTQRQTSVSQLNITRIEIGKGSVIVPNTNCTINFVNELPATLNIKQQQHDNQTFNLMSASDWEVSVSQPRGTLARQVCLTERLSKNSGGGFGRQIWHGTWHGEQVAVKIFSSRLHVKIWARETEVYTQLLSKRHDNVLGYIGSDRIDGLNYAQLFIVTQYHPLGSLYSYLIQLSQSLSHQQMLNICLSAVNGLLYLHTEIQGTRGKPALAHRNLTSKNILVKEDGTCTISELGLAITQDVLDTDKIDLLQGSKRYMSPEILDQRINQQCLEAFFHADIYSLGLILWEVCRQCSNDGDVLVYTAPYSEWLANANREPSLEEMRKLVVTDQRRPVNPEHWQSDSILTDMANMIKECWYTRPTSRLSILRIKKHIIKLASKNSKINLPLE